MKPLNPSDMAPGNAAPASLTMRLLPAIGWTRSFIARRRRIMLALATILFVAGFAWSLDAADIAFGAIAWHWLLGAVVLGFGGVVLNGLELSASAAAIGRRFPAHEAVHLSSVGILSNLLPVPASALVRGGALVSKGATIAESGRILLYVGLLRLSVAGMFTGAALLSGPLGLLIIAASALCSAVLFVLIARVGGVLAVFALLALRVGMLAIVAAQLLLGFWALGAAASLIDAALHSIAPVVGSAVGIVPGGLGVSEAIGAGLAVLAAASPAMAFAALALTRLAGYACAFLTVLGFQLRELLSR